jgi:hypothetical protein
LGVYFWLVIKEIGLAHFRDWITTRCLARGQVVGRCSVDLSRFQNLDMRTHARVLEK